MNLWQCTKCKNIRDIHACWAWNVGETRVYRCANCKRPTTHIVVNPTTRRKKDEKTNTI
jgi:DNA-directed RNA polymerase subunit RPC12/RpoP